MVDPAPQKLKINDILRPRNTPPEFAKTWRIVNVRSIWGVTHVIMKSERDFEYKILSDSAACRHFSVRKG